jgi:pimeloyl-ACP methyl ester carboxylesterase
MAWSSITWRSSRLGASRRHSVTSHEFTLLIFKHFRPRIDRGPLADDRTLAGFVPPTLVIAGAQDAMLDSHDTARRLSEYAPNVDMRLLPDTDHHLPGQAGTVLDFLTGSAHQNAQ